MATCVTSISVFGIGVNPGKVAVIAVARKLLMQLNAVARRGTPWMKQHANNCPSYQAGSA